MGSLLLVDFKWSCISGQRQQVNEDQAQGGISTFNIKLNAFVSVFFTMLHFTLTWFYLLVTCCDLKSPFHEYQK